MKPLRLLLLSALFYVTLLAVFGPNIRFHDTTPATTTKAPAIVYSPIAGALGAVVMRVPAWVCVGLS